MYLYVYLYCDVAILPACMSNNVWTPFNFHIHLVLRHPPLFLTLDREVRRHVPIMSSHAPGEGGKNAPVQITEGPSIAARFVWVITVLTRTPIPPRYTRNRRVACSLTRASVSAHFLRISYHRSTAEAALYDRQIRLWGLEAQQRCVPLPVHLTTLTMMTADV